MSFAALPALTNIPFWEFESGPLYLVLVDGQPWLIQPGRYAMGPMYLADSYADRYMFYMSGVCGVDFWHGQYPGHYWLGRNKR